MRTLSFLFAFSACLSVYCIPNQDNDNLERRTLLLTKKVTVKASDCVAKGKWKRTLFTKVICDCPTQEDLRRLPDRQDPSTSTSSRGIGYLRTTNINPATIISYVRRSSAFITTRTSTSAVLTSSTITMIPTSASSTTSMISTSASSTIPSTSSALTTPFPTSILPSTTSMGMTTSTASATPTVLPPVPVDGDDPYVVPQTKARSANLAPLMSELLPKSNSTSQAMSSEEDGTSSTDEPQPIPMKQRGKLWRHQKNYQNENFDEYWNMARLLKRMLYSAANQCDCPCY